MTVNVTSWSATPASNTSLDSINVQENVMTVAAVNNAVRSTMAGIKELTDDILGAKTTTGAANAYLLTTGMGFSAYAAGMGGMFKASFTNSTTATINIDSIGAKTFNKADAVSGLTTLVAGDICSGSLYFWAYEASADRVILLNPSTSGTGTSTVTTAAAAITDNYIVRGDGGTRGVQEAAAQIDDNGNFTIGIVAGATVGTIELGHASDTTITRSAAGVIAVEGVPLYSNIPQQSKSAAYTTVLGDAQKHIFHPSADTTARTFTIDSNANVAYPIGTAITFINEHSAGTLTIAITTDTMRLAGAGSTGNRTLLADGIATAIKITTTSWIISGTNLS